MYGTDNTTRVLEDSLPPSSPPLPSPTKVSFAITDSVMVSAERVSHCSHYTHTRALVGTLPHSLSAALTGSLEHICGSVHQHQVIYLHCICTYVYTYAFVRALTHTLTLTPTQNTDICTHKHINTQTHT